MYVCVWEGAGCDVGEWLDAGYDVQVLCMK